MTEPKKPEPMLEADFLELMADKERQIKRPPAPPKRRQPKITRMQSPRQRIAESQTKNPIKAIYGEESQWNATPTNDDLVGTHEVGPGDVHNSAQSYRAGKATVESPTGYSKKTYRARSNSTGTKATLRRGRPVDEAALTALEKEFEL